MDHARIADLLSPYLGGRSLSDSQLAQLATYLDLLLRWNARMNLTAVRAPEQVVTRHFGESLFAAQHLYPPDRQLATDNWQLLDLGSGPGFPGLPIKIWAPALRVALLESKQRKATFLREVVRALRLTGVEVIAARAEEYALQAGNPQSPIANATLTFRAVERFQQVLPTAISLLQRLPASTRRLALLIGAAQVEPARALANTLAWSDPLPLPESSQRVLLVGNTQ